MDTQKNSVAKAIALALICLMVFILPSKKAAVSPYYDTDSNSLFKNYAAHEVNYLYFLKDSAKEVELFFPENISQYTFDDVALYHDDTHLSGSTQAHLFKTDVALYHDDTHLSVNFEVIAVKEDHVRLILHEYVKAFNKIKVTYHEKERFLYTGDYRFEQSDYTISGYTIGEKHSLLEDMTYEVMRLNFNGALNQPKIQVILPQSVQAEGYLKTNALTFDGSTYRHKVKADDEALRRNQIERLSFDVLYAVVPSKDAPDKKAPLLTNIPFQLRPFSN